MRLPRILGCTGIALALSLWSSPPGSSATRPATGDGIGLAVSGRHAPVSSHRPPPQGYFKLRSVGSWSSLPGGRSCAGRIPRSTWEPRPQNREENHTMPSVKEVHKALGGPPRSRGGSYARKWDTWLLPRVTGHFAGTTDKIFQWAACKWGLSDNLLRAMTMRESTWYQFLHFRDGSVYPERGSGDYSLFRRCRVHRVLRLLGAFRPRLSVRDGGGAVSSNVLDRGRYVMAGVPRGGGGQTTRTGRSRSIAIRPRSLSTSWGANYAGASRAGSGGSATVAPATGPATWGCVGAWYAGAWHSGGAGPHREGAHRAQRWIWLHASFRHGQVQCDPVKGCPV